MATASRAKRRRPARRGHEILLQSPMEPITYPADNPGPHTLLTGAAEAESLDLLRWQMGRLVGYAGVVNHLGGKFTADVRALTPTLGEIAKRGLFYLDDGTSPQSLAREIAPTLGLASAAADAVVDADAAPGAIDAAWPGSRRSPARAARRSASQPPCRRASTASRAGAPGWRRAASNSFRFRR